MTTGKEQWSRNQYVRSWVNLIRDDVKDNSTFNNLTVANIDSIIDLEVNDIADQLEKIGIHPWR